MAAQAHGNYNQNEGVDRNLHDVFKVLINMLDMIRDDKLLNSRGGNVVMIGTVTRQSNKYAKLCLRRVSVKDISKEFSSQLEQEPEAGNLTGAEYKFVSRNEDGLRGRGRYGSRQVRVHAGQVREEATVHRGRVVAVVGNVEQTSSYPCGYGATKYSFLWTWSS